MDPTKFRPSEAFVCALTALAAAASASAEFLYDRIYIPVTTNPKFLPPDDTIWEFDPATGKSRPFADIPPELETGTSATIFTPDYQRLRASVFSAGRIVEVDGRGTVQPALEGILSAQDMAYDSVGNFYVLSQFNSRILRYPADGGQVEVFADSDDGIIPGGTMAIGPDDQLYWTRVQSDTILRFTPKGEGSVFVELNANFKSLKVDRRNTVFALGSTGIYRFDNADPNDYLHFNDTAWPSGTRFSLSADESQLYVARGRFFDSVNPLDGRVTSLGQLDLPGILYHFGPDIAVYIPEPATINVVLFPLLMTALRKRRYQVSFKTRRTTHETHRSGTVLGSRAVVCARRRGTRNLETARHDAD